MKFEGNYRVVMWDLSATGRQLLDSIFHIGAYYRTDDKDASFSQYVMPYKDLDSGAELSYNVQVTRAGKYRILWDIKANTGLPTKSEIMALKEYLGWLKAESEGTDGVILVYHEPTSWIIVPLLLEALNNYRLIDDFKAVVKGMANGVAVAEKYGNKDIITSLSLRSLCKTILNDTNPNTFSALDRSKVIFDVLDKISQENPGSLTESVLSVATSFEENEERFESSKTKFRAQNSLRPIFVSLLNDKRKYRRHQARDLQRIVVESGFQYDSLKAVYEDPDAASDVLSQKVGDYTDKKTLKKIIKLLDMHFVPKSKNNEVSSARF